MAINKEQVKQLLGNGLNAETVASAVGCEPSYISQLLGDEQFAQEVTVLRSQALMSHTERDNTANSIEKRLLDKISDAVDGHLIFKPRDLLAAYAVINRGVRRGASAPVALPASQTVVSITIPVVTAQRFVTTKAGEVVEADGQTLVSMPAGQLLRELSAKRLGKDKEDVYETARKFIPNAQD